LYRESYFSPGLDRGETGELHKINEICKLGFSAGYRDCYAEHPLAVGLHEKNKERKKERFGLVNNTKIQGHQESWLLKESVEKRSTLTKVKKRKSN
jgi:hypothetical protein